MDHICNIKNIFETPSWVQSQGVKQNFMCKLRRGRGQAMEVKGSSNLRRMFSPSCRGQPTGRGGGPGQGLTEAILKVELAHPFII